MSEDEAEASELPQPRVTNLMFGHEEAELAFLESYRTGRIPHAWLIGGSRGIGKATLAYRAARFVLAHPDPATPAVQTTTSLAVPDDNPAARRIASETHPDLLVLERTLNDKGKLRQDIAVEDVRRSVPFFGSTAGEGGWRVAIVDAIDELNNSGVNALLKIIEEPPARSLLLLVSHAPGRVAATIRSRCRRLLLRPLQEKDVAHAVAKALGRPANDAAIAQAAASSHGSVGRALDLVGGQTMALRQKIVDLLGQLPNPDQRALHALGDSLGWSEPQTLATFMDVVNGWLAERLKAGASQTRQLGHLAEAWDKVNGAARDVEMYNLERKPLVFTVFGLLAEAAGG